jgi:hypothetical protein
MVTVKVERAAAYDLGGVVFSNTQSLIFLSSTEKAFDVNRAPRDFAPDSLLWRINSLFSRIGFPVPVELIPCSAAQGIFGGSSGKILDSQWYSKRFFAQNGGIGEDSLLFPCNRRFWSVGRPADGPTVRPGHARKTPIRDAAPLRLGIKPSADKPPPTQAKAHARRRSRSSKSLN